MPETIEISYNNDPPGQVGPRPRKIPLKGTFRFTSSDPGVLTIEFTGNSPLANGARTLAANQDFTADKPGRFRFKCILEHKGKTITLGDPADPASAAGGELEIGP
jgi:hypothetical protein